jgi:trk system potassium uptake protein TrkH
MFCMVVCGCAGSTSGGMKVDRLLISAKVIHNRIKVQQHPNTILRVKIDGIVQDSGTQNLVTTFVVVYILVVLIGTIVYTLFGCDLMTGFSAAIANVSNVGPGFGEIGSMDNYSELPSVLKLNSTILMLIGRLEIFGFLQIFFLSSWK